MKAFIFIALILAGTKAIGSFNPIDEQYNSVGMRQKSDLTKRFASPPFEM